MPFAANYKDDQQNQNGQQGQNISGVSTSFNVPGSSGIGASKAPKSSGQYQNLEKYINANQQQGAQMGQKIAGNVEGQVQQAQKQIGDVAGSVQKTNVIDPNQYVNKAVSGTLSDADKAQYNQYKSTGGYSGPKEVSGLQDYSKAQSAATNAQTEVGKTGNEVGQQELLKETFARPNYTQGANKLDQVILGGSAQGKAAIQDLGNKYKNLNNQFSNQFSNAQKAIDTSQANAATNKATIATNEQKAMSDLMGGAQSRAEQLNQQNPQVIQQVQQQLESGNIENILSQLGVGAGSNLYGIDPSKYVNFNYTPMTANTAATADERARYAALNNLFGTQGNELSATNPMEGFNPVSYNKEGFTKELQGRQQQAEADAEAARQAELQRQAEAAAAAAAERQAAVDAEKNQGSSNVTAAPSTDQGNGETQQNPIQQLLRQFGIRLG